MPGEVGGRVRIAVAIVVATLATSVGMAPRAAAAPPKPWVEVQAQTVSGQDSYFNDVTVAPGGTIWAVGYRVNFLPGVTEFRTNVQRFNGTSFETVSTPDVEGPPAINFLNGVAANASNKVWAVGSARDPVSKTDRTRILRWNGTSWVAVTSPNPGTVHNGLNDVAATGDTAFAVGRGSSGGNEEPIVLQLNGNTWQSLPVARPANCQGNAGLQSVHAASPTAVYVVGRCAAGPNPSFVLRYNGVSWKTVLKPADFPGLQLNGFASNAAGTLYAVGGTSTGPAVVRVSPGAATAWPAPTGDTYWAAGTIGHDGIVMVGSSTVSGTSFAGPAIGTKASGKWIPQSVGPTFGFFTGVTTTDDGTIYSVGSKSGKPLVMRRAA